MSNRSSDDTRYVCYACIGDRYLSKEVMKQGTSQACSYCDAERETISLDDLGERVHVAIQEHFEVTPVGPETSGEYLSYRLGHWDRRGDQVETVVAEIASLVEVLAGDVTNWLDDHYQYAPLHDSYESIYGDEVQYEEKDADDHKYRDAWEKFRSEILHEARFFSNNAEEILRSIFGDLSSLKAFGPNDVIRTIDLTGEERFVWRARVAQSSDNVEKILKNPHDELGAPPPQAARAGRMNAEGISVFYGSLDAPTCIAEVRPPVGSQVVIGRFELLREARLLDLDALSRAFIETSVFDPTYREQVNRLVFLRGLVREIGRPVMPQDEDAEYVVTQVVAEYFANRTTPRLDGVIFNSSQTGGYGRNLVLFQHATALEPSEIPQDSYVEVHAYTDPEYEDSTTEFTIFESVANSPAPSRSEGEDQQGVSDASTLPDRPLPPGGESFMQLDVDSIEVLTIEGVRYDKKPHRVTRYRQTAEEAAEFDEKFS